MPVSKLQANETAYIFEFILKKNRMNSLRADFDAILNDVQTMLHQGMPSIDAKANSLTWLNVSKMCECFFLSEYALNLILIFHYLFVGCRKFV